MSDFNVNYYQNISDAAKRIAIITTDYTEKDRDYDRMSKDVENIKQLLRNLGFQEGTITEIKNKAKNVILKKTSDACTFDAQNDGYIIMFNLTYKKAANTFRAGQSCYSGQDIHGIFLVNNLLEWQNKPKLIFYQSPMYEMNDSNNSDGGSEYAAVQSNAAMDQPIDVDIFESFSNDGDDDSYGDENGSFYIQAVCGIINQHISDGSIKNTCLQNIMYEVHTKMGELVGDRGQQTPFTKSTLRNKFIFPV